MFLKWKLLWLEQPAASTSIWYEWNCSPWSQPEQPVRTYLNSSFPMPHSLPTSHREHPQGHFSSSCMIPVTLSIFCWPPHLHLAQHSGPWITTPQPQGGLAWAHCICSLAQQPQVGCRPTRVQESLLWPVQYQPAAEADSSLAGHARDLWDKEQKNIQVRMFAPGLQYLLLVKILPSHCSQ